MPVVPKVELDGADLPMLLSAGANIVQLSPLRRPRSRGPGERRGRVVTGHAAHCLRLKAA
jgi:hypothetical protein